MTASISFALRFALSIANFAAFVPKSLVSSSCAIRLCLIPVRLVIHSSLVSTIFSRSKFVKILAGAYAAMDINEAFGIYINLIFYLAKRESSSSITLFILESAKFNA